MTLRGHHFVILALVAVGFYYGYKHYKATGKAY
jgi:hypothetical protein